MASKKKRDDHDIDVGDVVREEGDHHDKTVQRVRNDRVTVTWFVKDKDKSTRDTHHYDLHLREVDKKRLKKR